MTAGVLRRETLFAAAGVGLLLATSTSAMGQGQFPDRPIKIIVPFAAGGAVDTMARIVGDKLASAWNQPVVIENRAGASGSVGAEAVAKAEPDGYTLLISPPPPLAINQHLFANLRFDPAAFAPITIIAGAPNVLLVRPGLGGGQRARAHRAREIPARQAHVRIGRKGQHTASLRRNAEVAWLVSRWRT